MKIYNNKKLLSIILSGIILINMTGCKSDNKITDNQIQDDNLINSSVQDNIVSTDTSITTDKNSSAIEAETSELNMTKDETILNYFNGALNNINDFLNSENVVGAKNKCKEYFITFADFIFYDGEISGITFDELKDETKMQVIKIVEKIDTLIMKKFPDYKENISDTSKDLYKKASELLHSGKENIEDYIIDKIGEDKYQDALDKIDEIKENDKQVWNDMIDYGSEVIETGKEKVKDWYESFRGN